jgi:hypothetical protein
LAFAEQGVTINCSTRLHHQSASTRWDSENPDNVAPALQRLDLVMRNLDEYPAIGKIVGCCLEKARA